MVDEKLPVHDERFSVDETRIETGVPRQSYHDRRPLRGTERVATRERGPIDVARPALTLGERSLSIRLEVRRQLPMKERGRGSRRDEHRRPHLVGDDRAERDSAGNEYQPRYALASLLHRFRRTGGAPHAVALTG